MLKSPMSRKELLALPAAVDVPTAGRAFGYARNKSYELARSGAFPCRVIRVGERGYRVPRSAILEALGIREDGTAIQEPSAAAAAAARNPAA